jgi:hypothetical protein
MKTVTAVFNDYHNDRQYAYLVPEGDDPQVGDVIITSVQWMDGSDDVPSQRVGLAKHIVSSAKIARVVAVDDVGSKKATKFYMACISTETIAERRLANHRQLERARRQETVRQKLEALLAEQSLKDRFATLAQTNAEAAALLKELDD